MSSTSSDSGIYVGQRFNTINELESFIEEYEKKDWWT
uniref:Uncharacterized protein n=1 Tax=Tetranychus urticae TaxID=32264 RepID=T1L301_TETUR